MSRMKIVRREMGGSPFSSQRTRTRWPTRKVLALPTAGSEYRAGSSRPSSASSNE
jgi:hypothetical protein